MRLAITTDQARAGGLSMSGIKWNVARGKMHRVVQGAYVMGEEPPTAEEVAAATVIAVGGIACRKYVGWLHGMDAVGLAPPFACLGRYAKSSLSEVCVASLSCDEITEVQGIPCTTGLRTILDLAHVLDDLRWEQALESGLRKELFTTSDLGEALDVRRRGNKRIRRVMSLRPDNAPPTESILETFMVQLIRQDATLPTPTRQLEIQDRYGRLVARVDLAFPDHRVFIELDGSQHKEQPLYDSSRQTRVVATTGWLVGRFTWEEVVRHPNSTLRRLRQLLDASRHT